MAQSKKVSSPVAASKVVHKSKIATKASAPKPAATSTTASAKHKSIEVGKSAAKPAAAKAKLTPKQSLAAKPSKKVDVKTVAKPVSQSTAPAAKKPAPVKAAPKSTGKATVSKVADSKVGTTKAAAPMAKAAVKVAPTPAAPKAVFNKESVRAAAAPAASQAKAMPAAVAKPAAQRITAPVAPKPVPVKAVAPVAAAPVVLSVAAAAAKKPVSARHGFKTNEFVVYPAHGVGRIVGIEEQEIAGMSLELFVITFDKDKMTLRVPTGKLTSVGMRKLAEEPVVRRSMETLKGRARVKRTMWSRRAQEYEAKINSGDLVAIAEVVRDLYRSETQPEQSYSERQLYEAALDRMSREIAAVDKIDERGAVQRITEILAKSAKGRRLAAEGAEAAIADAAEADDSDDADVKAA
jgi:CarD family transcriptional regulator